MRSKSIWFLTFIASIVVVFQVVESMYLIYALLVGDLFYYSCVFGWIAHYNVGVPLIVELLVNIIVFPVTILEARAHLFYQNRRVWMGVGKDIKHERYIIFYVLIFLVFLLVIRSLYHVFTGTYLHAPLGPGCGPIFVPKM